MAEAVEGGCAPQTCCLQMQQVADRFLLRHLNASQCGSETSEEPETKNAAQRGESVAAAAPPSRPSTDAPTSRTEVRAGSGPGVDASRDRDAALLYLEKDENKG